MSLTLDINAIRKTNIAVIMKSLFLKLCFFLNISVMYFEDMIKIGGSAIEKYLCFSAAYGKKYMKNMKSLQK